MERCRILGASAELESLLSRALEAIEEGTQAGAARGFAGLSAIQREEVLRRVERSHPEPFEALVRHAYDGFYSHPATITRLGLEPGLVQPRGYRIEPAAVPDLARGRAGSDLPSSVGRGGRSPSSLSFAKTRPADRWLIFQL